MTLTKEEIKILAELERGMDSGEIKFVIWRGDNRVAVRNEVMEELGLKHGQGISDVIFERILKLHLAIAQTEVAIDKAKQ